MRVFVFFTFLLSSVAVFAAAVDAELQSITIAMTQEPPNLNSLETTDLVSFFVLGHVSEGLVRYDRRGRLAPGIATDWIQKERTIRFNLRKNARWSDGSVVTAHDFVFSWRQMNNPAVASPYASIMDPIKNAKKIQAGEMPPSALGVTAIDDFTLEVDLERPCGYCVTVMNHSAFYPIKQAFYESQGERYGAEVENLLYNGPFKLVKWIHDAEMTLIKNPDYWNHAAINLKELHVGYITADNRTRLNLFRDDQIALARLGADTVADAASQQLRMKSFVSGGMAYIRFNTVKEKITGNKKLRQAIRLVIDPDEFVNKVIGIPGYKPAYSFFPGWLNGVTGKFTDEYPVAPVVLNAEKARQLIEEVKQDLGVDEIPAITVLSTTSPTGARIAEFIQGRLKQALDLDVKVDQQTFKQFLVKIQRGDFDISLASWYPDFDDIVTYADLLASYNANNSGRYNNPEYDRWLEVLLTSSDSKTRMDAADKLQKIIIEDVPVLPLAETGSAYVQNPKLKGVVRRVLGADPDYTFARVID
ncbi:MAG: oligopeptide transport system substrate-binding protein [Candidatus Azotimanducaceae bacterium]|jgi:oligopeptide transport system substrate-binding protein